MLTLNMKLDSKAILLEYAGCERVCTSDKVPAAFVPLPVEHWLSFRCDCFNCYTHLYESIVLSLIGETLAAVDTRLLSWHIYIYIRVRKVEATSPISSNAMVLVCRMTFDLPTCALATEMTVVQTRTNQHC